MKSMPRALSLLLAFGLVLSGAGLLALGATPSPAEAAVRQSGRTVLLPQIVHNGNKAAASRAARLTGSVHFRPARAGRPVVIQRRVGRGPWRKVTVARQNRNGVVGFNAPAFAKNRPYVYRGVAQRFKGLRPVAATPMSAAAWKVRFFDEFGGTALNSKKWSDRVSNAGSRTCSLVGDRRASQVSGGTLRLSVKRDPQRLGQTCRVVYQDKPYKVGRYLNGQVSTMGKFSQTRGVFAARVKFPRNRGQHGSFWLQPDQKRYIAGNPRQSGAEIDIVEFFGQGYPQGGLASFLYNYGINGGNTKIGGLSKKATRMLPRGETWWNSFHVFSLEWTPSTYIFRVDGREHWRTKRGVSAVNEYLILSMLSSDWELAEAKKLGITPGGTMHVDWAKVWSK